MLRKCIAVGVLAGVVLVAVACGVSSTDPMPPNDMPMPAAADTTAR